MKKINIRFEQDKTLDTVDIVIRAASHDEQVDALMESLAQREPVRLTVLNQANCPTVIDEKDIVLISADGKNIRIVTLRDVFHAKQSLQSVEGILSGNFLRVSRFEIINLKMVRKYDFTLVGTLRIEFENGILNETVVNTSGFPEQIVQELFPDGPSVFSDPFTVVIEEESQYPKEITVSQVEDKTVAPPAEVVLPYTGQPQECPYKATAGYTVSLNDPQTDAGSEYY